MTSNSPLRNDGRAGVKGLALLILAAMALAACTSTQKRETPVPGASGQPNANPASGGRPPTAVGAEEERPEGRRRSRRPEIRAWKTYTDRVHQVSLRHPPEWRGPMAGTSARHEGASGFFDLGAASGNGMSLKEVCRSEAHHKLRPFGSKPRIETLRVQGREACLILPSSDQDSDMKGQAQLLVRYPEPVEVRGSRYELFALFADRGHVRPIAETVRFLRAAPGGRDGTHCSRVSGGKAGVAAHLVDIRVGSHAGYDQMTFVFKPATVPTPGGGRRPTQPGTPRYEVETAKPPFVQDPSDRPMTLSGRAFSRITVHGASGVDLSGPTARQTYRGPRQLRPGFRVLREAQEESDFESTMSWILGLSRPRCARVLELTNPLRLVVQYPH